MNRVTGIHHTSFTVADVDRSMEFRDRLGGTSALWNTSGNAMGLIAKPHRSDSIDCHPQNRIARKG
jgi:hypothetical protein